MANNKKGIIIVIVIVALLFVVNYSKPNPGNAQLLLSQTDTMAHCQETRPFYSSNPCVGECVQLTQDMVNCYATTGSSQLNSKVGQFWFYYSQHNSCGSLIGDDLSRWNCFYNEASVGDELQAAGMNVDVQASKIIGSFTLFNPTSVVKEGIIEMEVQKHGVAPQSTYAGPQETCNPAFPNNVYKTFRIASGSSLNVQLESTNDLAVGSYDVYVSTVTKCYTTGDTSDRSIQPWGYNTLVGTQTVGSVTPCTGASCDGGSNTECKLNSDCAKGLTCNDHGYCAQIGPNCQFYEKENTTNGNCDPNMLLIIIAAGFIVLLLVTKK